MHTRALELLERLAPGLLPLEIVLLTPHGEFHVPAKPAVARQRRLDPVGVLGKPGELNGLCHVDFAGMCVQ
jgi:hypothetical protein